MKERRLKGILKRRMIEEESVKEKRFERIVERRERKGKCEGKIKVKLHKSYKVARGLGAHLCFIIP